MALIAPKIATRISICMLLVRSIWVSYAALGIVLTSNPICDRFAGCTSSLGGAASWSKLHDVINDHRNVMSEGSKGYEIPAKLETTVETLMTPPFYQALIWVSVVWAVQRTRAGPKQL